MTDISSKLLNFFPNVYEKFLWKWLIGVWTEIWLVFLITCRFSLLHRMIQFGYFVSRFWISYLWNINLEWWQWFCWLDSNEQTSSNFFLFFEYNWNVRFFLFIHSCSNIFVLYFALQSNIPTIYYSGYLQELHQTLPATTKTLSVYRVFILR